MADIKITVRKILRSELNPKKLLRRGLKIKKPRIEIRTKRKRFSRDFSSNRSKRFIAMKISKMK
jgi:hypothetical protein